MFARALSLEHSMRPLGRALQLLQLLLLAATLLLVAGAEAPPKYPLRLEDIVIAYPADDRHIVVAKASRVWRKGIMRTYIANNNPPSPEIVADGKLHNETWGYYPDDNPRRSLYPGDSRAGLVPFLAHKHFGDTYKWLLYMDDDTIFFPDAVLRLLEDFDPDMPYFITDHLWWPDPATPGRSNHPNKAAPRCLPCHFDDSGFNRSAMPFPAPKGCPCTPELLCQATAEANLPIFNRFCDMPRAPITTYSMHGGAGGIMSIGLMRKVSFEFMERCTKSLYSTGGDAFISICLWQAGYAMTDPGLGLFIPGLQYFDPGPEDRVGAMLKLSQYIDSTSTKQCNKTCEMDLEHMVSLHVRSRMFNTLDDAASFIRGVSIMYDVYADIRRTKRAAADRLAEAASGAKAAAAVLPALPGGMAAVAAADAVQATAAAAAAAVAAAATSAAQRLGPDGKPMSQSEEKQKELAAALAMDAQEHQADHRNATAVRERQVQQKQAMAKAHDQVLLRTAVVAAAGSDGSNDSMKPAATQAEATGQVASAAPSSGGQSSSATSGGSDGGGSGSGAASSAGSSKLQGGDAAAGQGGSGVGSVPRKLAVS